MFNPADVNEADERRPEKPRKQTEWVRAYLLRHGRISKAYMEYGWPAIGNSAETIRVLRGTGMKIRTDTTAGTWYVLEEHTEQLSVPQQMFLPSELEDITDRKYVKRMKKNWECRICGSPPIAQPRLMGGWWMSRCIFHGLTRFKQL